MSLSHVSPYLFLSLSLLPSSSITLFNLNQWEDDVSLPHLLKSTFIILKQHNTHLHLSNQMLTGTWFSPSCQQLLPSIFHCLTEVPSPISEHSSRQHPPPLSLLPLCSVHQSYFSAAHITAPEGNNRAVMLWQRRREGGRKEGKKKGRKEGPDVALMWL